MKEISGFKNLTTLVLGSTKVTDVGMKELAGLSNLTTIGLGHTKVTGAGLNRLAIPSASPGITCRYLRFCKDTWERLCHLLNGERSLLWRPRCFANVSPPATLGIRPGAVRKPEATDRRSPEEQRWS
jgi:hypothetical protein